MSLEIVGNCPVCHGQSFRPFLECKDHTTTGEAFHVEQCSACGFLLTNPRPTEETTTRYYQSSRYISHQSRSTGLLDSIYLIIRHFTLRWKFKLINPYLTHHTVLDYGCGTGAFLQYCKNQGKSASGVEPSTDARKIAQSNALQVAESLEALTEPKFDVITLWHVLEHVYSLERTIQALAGRLHENGTIFIAVPNHESYDAAHYASYWAAYDVPRHVWHFSKKDMTLLLEKNGLQVIKIVPMKLDAYYVSLLSEKYKSQGRLTFRGLVAATLTGWKSNLKARAHLNYSSLIYVAQK